MTAYEFYFFARFTFALIALVGLQKMKVDMTPKEWRGIKIGVLATVFSYLIAL